MSTVTVDPIGLWLFKWVYVPLVALLVLAWTIDLEVMKRRCNKMAKERGYLEATYIPASRAGIGAQCICRKRLKPDGSCDETARLVIDLD